MKRFPPRFCLSITVLLFAALTCRAQSSDSGAQPQSDTEKSQDQNKKKDSKGDEKDKDSTAAKKKPKKVWTNDEISTVGGTVSVVGDSSSSNSASSSKTTRKPDSDSSQSKEIQKYRDQLQQLWAQLDATDKKIEELRNFKADNSSPSGGINPHHGYYTTPIADQIKQLEDKKKQIQEKIDAIEDEARKKGIEPGQLR